jgi:hypothetical protein
MQEAVAADDVRGIAARLELATSAAAASRATLARAARQPARLIAGGGCRGTRLRAQWALRRGRPWNGAGYARCTRGTRGAWCAGCRTRGAASAALPGGRECE